MAAALGSVAASMSLIAPNLETQAKTLPPLVVCTSPQGTYVDNFNPFASGNLAGTFGNVYESLFYFDAVSGRTFDLLGTSFHFTNGNRTLVVALRQSPHHLGQSRWHGPLHRLVFLTAGLQV